MRFLAPYQSAILSIVRIIAAYLFIWHGTSKVFGFPDPKMASHFSWVSIYGVAAALEIIGGGLLLLGLFTRPVAFLLSGQMAVAYFMFHAKSSALYPLMNGGESAVLFCFIFLYLAAAGGGCLSLDARLNRYRS